MLSSTKHTHNEAMLGWEARIPLGVMVLHLKQQENKDHQLNILMTRLNSCETNYRMCSPTKSGGCHLAGKKKLYDQKANCSYCLLIAFARPSSEYSLQKYQQPEVNS